MRHYPAQFGLRRNPEFGGVVAGTLDADENIAFDNGRLLVRKSDDIGQRIVIQIIYVKPVQIVVVTENIRERHELAVFAGQDFLEPIAQAVQFRIGKGERCFFKKKLDRRVQSPVSERHWVKSSDALIKVKTHFHGAPRISVLDAVADLAHEEHAAAAFFAQVFGNGGVGHLVGVKTAAFVFDHEAQAFFGVLGRDTYLFVGFQAVAMINGIGHGLGEGEQHTPIKVFPNTTLLGYLANIRLYERDVGRGRRKLQCVLVELLHAGTFRCHEIKLFFFFYAIYLEFVANTAQKVDFVCKNSSLVVFFPVSRWGASLKIHQR